ncbi:hypothetical protein K450DRAFT_275214 [Umbelopsis ramanniana AG]|uniref:Alpha/beta hydrolase fold-3 domain-containing protein n=1 Tax=Umbelopsis ramanniana AG TaxID=1314678 RepID=A0AAD5E390_UMBRA|nr:uncharacterized protein K450DRAFT_275214 [Umbelopsis ramanniana AG]KAI8575934.1 hypothetical protein K450DRAFT_275214 [Umbelopsis ramanniana AG]
MNKAKMIFKEVIPRTPLIVGTIVKHYTRGPPAEEWTLKQHLTVNLVKDLVGKMRNYTVEDIQKINQRPTPLPPGFKSIPFTIPSEYRERALEKLAPLLEPFKTEIGWDWQQDQCDPITGEWIIPEDLMNDQDTPDIDIPTLLYFPGGAYHICSIQTHRFLTSRAAKHGKCKTFAINYRLAPQHPFPAAVIDSLAAYLYLTDPPADAGFNAIDVSKIVMGGDSAGGGLVMATALAIRDLQLPAPAGVVALSPWLDLTHSLPSIFNSIDTDYLPKAGFDYLDSPALDFSKLPQERTTFPDALDIASENPTDTAQEPEIITKTETINDQVVEKKHVKRIQLYAPNEALMVPYVSPVFDPLGLQGLPPLLIESGGAERLHDEAVYAAHSASQQAPATAMNACQPTKVTINVYEGQPHVFQMFVDLQVSKQSFETIGSFIQHVTGGEQDAQHRFEKQFERFSINGKGQSVDLTATEFSTETWAEWKKLLANPSVEQRMEEAKQYGIKVKGV